MFGNSAKSGYFALILSLKFLAADSIKVKTKIFLDSMSFNISPDSILSTKSSIIVVLPDPAVAETDIKPPL